MHSPSEEKPISLGQNILTLTKWLSPCIIAPDIPPVFLQKLLV